MDRVYFKTRAKQVLQNNFWYLVGIILIVALLSLDLIGASYETIINTNGYSEMQIVFHIFNFDFNYSTYKASAFVVAIALINFLFAVFVTPVLNYGKNNIFKYASMGRIHEMNLFDGFKNNYGRIITVNVVKSIVIFGYTLLFIIPGIIKIYELRFTNEILEEHPDWGYQEVFAESKRLTEGLKMELFVLDLSFFGWALVAAVLSTFTLGLASYAFNTYPEATNAEVYLWLKQGRKDLYSNANVFETEVNETYVNEDNLY